jgi:hypothetical protein
MSQENVEIVRRVFALMDRAARGEPVAGMIDWFAEDVQIDMSRRVFNPDVYEGPTAFGASDARSPKGRFGRASRSRPSASSTPATASS